MNETKSYFYSLDVFRGIAALLVTLGHIQINGIFWGKGTLCVDFFFILSGFILQYKYFYNATPGDAVATRRFISHRIARLYPLHIVMVLLIALFWLAVGYMPPLNDRPEGVAFELLQSLFMLQGMGFTIFSNPINPPGWSIGTEFWINIIFVCFFIKKRTITRACIVFLVYLFSFSYAKNLDSMTGYLYFNFLSSGLVRTVAGFFLGTILYDTFRFLKEKWNPGFLIVTVYEVLVLSATLIFAYMTRGKTFYGIDICYVFFFSALIMVFAFDRGALSVLFKSCRLYYLGYISYSLYMINYLLFWFLRDVPKIITTTTTSSLFVYLTILIAVSSFSYWLFEKPTSRYLRNCIDDILVFSDKGKRIFTTLLAVVTFCFALFFVYAYKQVHM